MLDAPVAAAGDDHQLAGLAGALVQGLGMVEGDLDVSFGVHQDQGSPGHPLHRRSEVLGGEPSLQVDGVSHSHVELATPDPSRKMIRAGWADRDRPGDLRRAGGGHDREKPPETRPADGDSLGVHVAVGGEQARDLDDRVYGVSGHAPLGGPVTREIEGQRRPPGGCRQACEVRVVLLP